MDDDELLAEIEPIGLNLVKACVDLDEMIERGNVAVSQEDAATKRYWVAMSVKAETLAERVSLLLMIQPLSRSDEQEFQILQERVEMRAFKPFKEEYSPFSLSEMWSISAFCNH